MLLQPGGDIDCIARARRGGGDNILEIHNYAILTGFGVVSAKSTRAMPSHRAAWFAVLWRSFASPAAVLENHEQSWEAAGLTSRLASGYLDALLPELFAAVADAAPTLMRESLNGETHRFGKKNTWWMPLVGQDGARTQPVSDLEAAIHALHELDFGSAVTPIVGAEWWIQEQGPDQGIGFHYDKDEAYASEHMTMRFPEVSTVTYLSASGAPTLILNQTTPDGNEEIPPLPREGFVVHPHPNKHLIFRGNLQHGVSALLARRPPGEQQTKGGEPGTPRRTLLVNWWRQPPLEPNCVPFKEERWRRLNLLRDADVLLSRSRHRLASRSSTRSLLWSAMHLDPLRSRSVAVEIPPTDLLFLDFPAAADLQAGNWQVEWSDTTSVGPLTRLDLHHQTSLNSLFADRRPKLFFVLPTRGSLNWAGALPKWMKRLHARYSHDFRFVMVDPNGSQNFMSQFNIRAADAPTVVLHDTLRGDTKRRLQSSSFTYKAVHRFVVEYARSISAPTPELHEEL